VGALPAHFARFLRVVWASLRRATALPSESGGPVGSVSKLRAPYLSFPGHNARGVGRPWGLPGLLILDAVTATAYSNRGATTPYNS
jgi:hypothetical protein